MDQRGQFFLDIDDDKNCFSDLKHNYLVAFICSCMEPISACPIIMVSFFIGSAFVFIISGISCVGVIMPQPIRPPALPVGWPKSSTFSCKITANPETVLKWT